ncbi:MAG: hypothetical protein U5K30_01960 [Acidimicrobiales bacterium]|nr:hypothetical protein [Acidimicrobiales bacterium]
MARLRPPGLLVAGLSRGVGRAAGTETPRPESVSGAAFLREWCSQVWATGGSVRYHPDVTSVRVRGDGGEASTPLRESSWQRVLDLRPQRPTELSEGAWRYLLARDDVESCRR